MSTIVALATPPGNGAIHVIRLSGSNAYEIINKISNDIVIKNNERIQLTYLRSRHKKLIDQVLLIKFYSPFSYTGEDLIEINCHGSNLISKMIIDELIRNGAVCALPGEFTKRAFLNNKIDLNQALNVNSLFQARSENEIYFAVKEIKEGTSKKIREILDMLLSCIAECEVNIDYPPEIEKDDIDIRKKINIKVKKILRMIETIIDNSKSYKSSSFRIVLVGKPNVGKSSLINYLLKKDRVIVSDIAGTTRDSVEIEYFFEGFLITFVDTAGITEKTNQLEYKGIQKTKEEIYNADLIFHLISVTDIDVEDKKIVENLKGKNVIKIFTKSDLLKKRDHNNSISVKNGEIDYFLNSIREYLKSFYSPVHFKSQEYINFLNNALKELKKALDLNLPLDLLSSHLSDALSFLDPKKNISLISHIFSSFCVGK